MRPPTLHASGLTRNSIGLTDAHRELIKLLAGIAVQQYLDESEHDHTDDQEVLK